MADGKYMGNTEGRSQSHYIPLRGVVGILVHVYTKTSILIPKMDNILEYINGKFIALPVEEVNANNVILNKLLDNIIDKMKAKNPLFSILFSKKFCGGSYWDGVKVSKPDEYDIHIQCKLDVYTKRLQPSNEPGWINLKMQRSKIPDTIKIKRRRPYYGLPGLHCLVNNEDYLDTEKVMLWIHQTLSSSLGGEKKGKKRHCVIDLEPHGIFKLSFRRHGPAFTFHAKGTVEKQPIEIDLDFVPCFVFPGSQYPANGFLPNPVPHRPDIFIVSKPVKHNNKSTRYWRVSFQEQERQLINGLDRLKPSLRLMKKMRDKLKHDSIASYYIKNLFLWEVSNKPSSFWNEPLSHVFMQMLRIYQRAIENKRIDFFWYSSDNLIQHVKPEILSNINQKLVKVIADLEKHQSNHIIVAKYFLTRRELRLFKKNYGK